MPKPVPTVEDLRRRFNYDPHSGILTWKIAPANRVRAGAVAGCRTIQGKGETYRLIVNIRGTVIKVHRIIWALVTGAWPIDEIDHINGDACDNRWENLRLATRTEQLWNIRRVSTNKTGLKGSYFRKECGKFCSQIRENGVKRHLGLFDTAEQAHEAYMKAARKRSDTFIRHS